VLIEDDDRALRASAISIPSETPSRSEQLNDSSATHATVEVAIAVFFKAIFMNFLHRPRPLCNGTPAISLMDGAFASPL
jgi:hypothetical protein